MTYENQAAAVEKLSDKQAETNEPAKELFQQIGKELEAQAIPDADESAAVPVLTPDLPAHGHSAAQAENPDHESPFAAGAVEGSGDADEADVDQTFSDMSATQETIDNAEREADA